MPNDEDWVADVRRWVAAGSRNTAHRGAAKASSGPEDHDDAIGYEAAHPVLQAAQWPDAPRSSGFGSLGA